MQWLCENVLLNINLLGQRSFKKLWFSDVCESCRALGKNNVIAGLAKIFQTPTGLYLSKVILQNIPKKVLIHNNEQSYRQCQIL